MKLYFAHAGEVHGGQASMAASWISSAWIAIPLLILVLIGVYFILDKLKVDFPRILFTIQVLLFTLSIAGWSFSPAIAGTAIALGFGITLFAVMASLGSHGGN